MKEKMNCPVLELFDLLGKKWVLVILYFIEDGNHSFTEICNKLPQMSGKILSNRLSLLQENKLIIKKVESTTPIKSRYYLTELGKKISVHIQQIANIVGSDFKEV